MYELIRDLLWILVLNIMMLEMNVETIGNSVPPNGSWIRRAEGRNRTGPEDIRMDPVQTGSRDIFANMFLVCL